MMRMMMRMMMTMMMMVMMMMMLPESCASVGITSPVTATTRSDVSLLRRHQMTPPSPSQTLRGALEHHYTTPTEAFIDIVGGNNISQPPGMTHTAVMGIWTKYGCAWWHGP